MRPIVNNNGDKREELVKQCTDAMDALMEAMKKLSHMAPHGRNYLGNNTRYQEDRKLYCERFNTLEKMHHEIQQEALAIHNGDC